MNEYEIMLNLAANSLVSEWISTAKETNISRRIKYESVHTLIKINDILNSYNTEQEKLNLIKEEIEKVFSKKREPIKY